MTEDMRSSSSEGRVPRTEVRGMAESAEQPRIFHVWFCPKRRARALEGDIRTEVFRSLNEIARDREMQLIARGSLPDHIHLLLRLPAKLTLSQAMRYLKGASARHVFQTIPELKGDLRSEHFWQRGYGAKAVEPGAVPTIREYIRDHDAPESLEPRTSVRGAALHRDRQGHDDD